MANQRQKGKKRSKIHQPSPSAAVKSIEPSDVTNLSSPAIAIIPHQQRRALLVAASLLALMFFLFCAYHIIFATPTPTLHSSLEYNEVESVCSATEGSCSASNSNDRNDRTNTQTQTQQHIQKQHEQDNDGYLFYAWPESAASKEDSLLNALFPNLTRFQSAWEAYPLLSRVSFVEENEVETKSETNAKSHIKQIPTILHDRKLITQLSSLTYQHPSTDSTNGKNNGNKDPLLSLFSTDDIPTILSQPNMQHGSDYKLIKKIILPPSHPEAGEEYNGMLPNPHYSMDEVMKHFHYGGFSLVVNKMQKRWSSVADLAQRLEEELGVMSVGANMYVTPEVLPGKKDRDGKDDVVRQGFESHWDWMDVIVIQLSGRKRWSVAREPSIYLSNKDQKRKPTNAELGRIRRYSEFTLCPGDVLYIPRGHVHNASTVIFDNMLEDGEGEARSNEGEAMLDLNNCPSYPKGVSSAELPAARLDGPSLHITFGLLQSNDATIESLLHFALNVYFDKSHSSVAVPANTACPNPTQTAVEYDLDWKSVLHHMVSELARREHVCDTISSERTDDFAGPNSRRCDGTAILRQSVPLLMLENNDLVDARPTSAWGQYSNLKQVYLLALDLFASSASIPKTAQFIQKYLLHPNKDGEELIYHYPGYSQKDIILCPALLNHLSKNMYQGLMKSFLESSKDSFDAVLKAMNIWGRGQRDDDRKERRMFLEMAGQR